MIPHLYSHVFFCSHLLGLCCNVQFNMYSVLLYPHVLCTTAAMNEIHLRTSDRMTPQAIHGRFPWVLHFNQQCFELWIIPPQVATDQLLPALPLSPAPLERLRARRCLILRDSVGKKSPSGSGPLSHERCEFSLRTHRVPSTYTKKRKEDWRSARLDVIFSTTVLIIWQRYVQMMFDQERRANDSSN